jgi:small conductance mechanosensitive channel
LYDVFQVANEILASIGIASGLVAIALQNMIKNVIAGIGIYLNPEIDVGDVIEIDGIKGVIAEIHLTKTVMLTDEGVKYFIPNLKFSETVVGIS